MIARAMQPLGFRLCTISSDQTLLRTAARSELADARAGELKNGARHWKNRFEHQYIVNVGAAARERRGGVSYSQRPGLAKRAFAGLTG